MRGTWDLIITVDRSENGGKIYAVIGISEHILKDREFSRNTTWIRHYKDLGSNKKKQYLVAFKRRYMRIKPLLILARICFTTECVQKIIDQYNPAVVLIDDGLFDKIEFPRKVRESRIKEKHRRKLMNLADNLANYFRYLLKQRPEKILDEQKVFEK